jgi:D-glycero-D-manno-heptose 1,7-bisphosphate phosphatase
VSGGWSGSPDRGPLAFQPAGAVDLARGRPAAFLDRDGVINEAVPDSVSRVPEAPLEVDQVRLLPGVAKALGELRRAGYALVCVSNQPAAAKGNVSVERLQQIHERVIELLAGDGVALDASRLCPHHPEGIEPGLSWRCECRKPAPGMLLDVGSALGIDLGVSWMLGDTDADVQAGQAADIATVLIEYPGSAHKRLGGASPDLLAVDLADAVAQLLDHGAG